MKIKCYEMQIPVPCGLPNYVPMFNERTCYCEIVCRNFYIFYRTLGDSLFCIYDIEQHKKERQLYDEAFNNQ